MNTTIRLSCDSQGNFAFRFPDRCVYCGGARETELDWNISFVGYWQGREAKHATRQRVPYCARHARESKFATSLETGIGCGVWVLVFAWLFFAVFGERTGILGIYAIRFLSSLALALVPALLATLIIRRVLRAIRPTARDQLDILGAKAEFTPDGRNLEVTFTNEQIAAEFSRLNSVPQVSAVDRPPA